MCEYKRRKTNMWITIENMLNKLHEENLT